MLFYPFCNEVGNLNVFLLMEQKVAVAADAFGAILDVAV